jgi:hypothetical protein
MPRLIEKFETYNANNAQQSISGTGVSGVGGGGVPVSNLYKPTATPYGAGNVQLVSGGPYTGAGTTYNGQGSGNTLVSPPANNSGYQGHY